VEYQWYLEQGLYTVNNKPVAQVIGTKHPKKDLSNIREFGQSAGTVRYLLIRYLPARDLPGKAFQSLSDCFVVKLSATTEQGTSQSFLRPK
jgi:hypothetical protein